jgi:hypothetical protein
VACYWLTVFIVVLAVILMTAQYCGIIKWPSLMMTACCDDDVVMIIVCGIDGDDDDDE